MLKFTLSWNLGNNFEKKYVELVSSQVVGGIFSSKVSDFRVLNP